MGLSAKQEKFVDEYLIDLNATQAAIRAGYSECGAPVQGNRLLTNANVKAEIAKRQVERSKRTTVSQDYVLTTIVDVVERCKKNGVDFNANGALKGAELLGRHLGMFDGQGAGEDEAPPAMTFNVQVAPAVGDVRVTKPE